MKASKILTSRSTVIALFSAISAALLVASSVPQRASLGGKTPPWVGRLPDGLKFLSTSMSLDNVVGSGWFALLVALFWLSLLVSTVSQFKAARAQSRRLPKPALPAGCVRVAIALPAFDRLAKASGYRLAQSGDGVHRYVKNMVGYWGNFLLHVGIVTAVAFSLIYVLTQHRVLVRLVGQEITGLSAENVREMRGVWPLQDRLPNSVVLKTVQARFWQNDKLEYLSSELYFTDRPGNDPRRVDVALSDKSQFGPYIVYQANDFGMAFDLELVSQKGEVYRERLYLPYPNRRDAAGYGETELMGTDFLLKGKFYADAQRKTMQLNSPPLTVRLYRGKELQGEVAVTPGKNSQLGPFAVRLAHSDWWTDIMLDGTFGTAGIFAGFALILAGVLSSYCLVPRELIVREGEGALYLQHEVRRFALFYREEFEDIIKAAGKTGES
jgi:cytochrome c biogenesis protein